MSRRFAITALLGASALVSFVSLLRLAVCRRDDIVQAAAFYGGPLVAVLVLVLLLSRRPRWLGWLPVGLFVATGALWFGAVVHAVGPCLD